MHNKTETIINEIKSGKVPSGYKKTKIGIFPVEWEIKKLSNYLFVNHDKNTDLCYSKNDVFSISGEYGIVNQIKLLGRSFAGVSVAPYGVVYPFDIVYTKSPLKANPYGIIKSNLTNKTGIVSTLYAIYHCKDNVFSQFVQYYFSDDIRLNNYLYPLVNIGAKHDMKISDENALDGYVGFPSYDEQRKIADILKTQDKVIELKEKLLKEKQKEKKFLMQQLLTGKIRLKGFISEWIEVTLSKILKEGSKKAVSDTSKYRKITVKLNLLGLEFSDISREMKDKRPFYIRHKGEIIIGKQNFFNGSIAIVDEEFDGCICSNAIMSFSVVNANNVFVKQYISQSDYLKKREILANGTGQKELSENEFLSMKIFLPEIKEQKAIVDIISTKEKEIELIKQGIDNEKQKKKALMQLLFTGIVRVL